MARQPLSTSPENLPTQSQDSPLTYSSPSTINNRTATASYDAVENQNSTSNFTNQQYFYDAPPSHGAYNYSTGGGDSPTHFISPATSNRSSSSTKSDDIELIQNSLVGGDFGPYNYESIVNSNRNSIASSIGGGSRTNLLSTSISQNSRLNPSTTQYSSRTMSNPSPFALGSRPNSLASNAVNKRESVIPIPIWSAKDTILDDKLHNSSAYDEQAKFAFLSKRGWLNMGSLILLVTALIALFGGYPIVQFYTSQVVSTYGSFNLGGINATGQIPLIPGLPTLIDKNTPPSALSRTGFDGKKYVLAFSDEFDVDGRTFWPGDDPFWEAVDLHYWATGDYEWYDPDAVTTKDGNLVITVTEEPIHGLAFRSGMLQSWNKFCFTGGYVEVSISLPGSNIISGFWPGAWTMGNLARAGYGSTTEGTWPYSYNSCDVGTLKNQTNSAGTLPVAARTTGSQDYGGSLSYQPGQRLSACTCESAGDEHPGPVGVGRGSPEIDILEAQISYANGVLLGSVSQSAQIAPYDAAYQTLNTTPNTIIFNSTSTYLNDYLGGIYQEAVSAVTYTNPTAYELGGGLFEKYGVESYPDPSNGYITWSAADVPTWTMKAAAIGPNAKTEVSQRLVSEEPMYLILNLGISASFQTINWAELQFPAKMLVDYVRVYQREDSPNIGCDPADRPTSKYIQNHLNAYTNPNLTTWEDAGYAFPQNSLVKAC